QDAYRRVEVDARIAGARPDQLGALCYLERAVALGSAVRAHAGGDNLRRSAGLTRALAALTALQLGVDGKAAAAPALQQFYAGLRQTVLDSVPNFNAARLAGARRDVDEVAAALTGSPDRSIPE
ncbi:MAG: hypothetical protein RL339_1701, partial [Pseudomonadota bacterium]